MAVVDKPSRIRARVPPQRYPRAVELAYTAQLLRVLGVVRTVVDRHLYVAERLLVQHRQAMKLDAAEDWNDTMAGIRLAVDQTFPSNTLGALAKPYAERAGAANKAELERQVRQAIGIAVPVKDPKIGQRLEAWTTENVGLIKSIETQYLDDVQTVVTRSIADGDRWEELAAELADRFDVSESRAALIARDQVGKFYAAVNEARQVDLGITHFFWRTSGDERVRPEHQELEGKRFSWANPPKDGAPGQPINCRCTAEPDFAAVIDALED